MTMYYVEPERADNPHALPDVEVFYVTRDEARAMQWYGPDSEPVGEPGWYYWYCLPGCLPDSEPDGPYATEAAALEAARA